MTQKFLPSNVAYLIHAYLFAFIALLAFWASVLIGPMTSTYGVVLAAIVFLFTYAFLFSLFEFVLGYVYSVGKVKKNRFQHYLIQGLFALVNVVLSVGVVWFAFATLPGKITEMEIQTRFRSLTAVHITGYRQLRSSNFDFWAKTQYGTEFEMSQIPIHGLDQTKKFFLKRVGPVTFFTHQCHDGLDMSNKDLVKLLLGREVTTPAEVIETFANPYGYSASILFNYFQKFDSITLTNPSYLCSKISINDYNRRSHAYGPAIVSRIDNSSVLVQYTDKETWKVEVFNTTSMQPRELYSAKNGEAYLLRNEDSQIIFIINLPEKQIISANVYTGEVLQYNIPSTMNFFPVGAVGTSPYLQGIDEQGVGQNRSVLIGPRYSTSRKKIILDRLWSL